MSKYFLPYNNSSKNIKIELELSNYVTKKDIKNITHIDASGFASKTNLAALKIEDDKIDTDKLKTNDLAKLSNAVKNDVVKKADYNTKISNIKTQITAVNKNTLDNLADIKVLETKTVDTSNFVTRTKFSPDTNVLDDKIDKVDKKIPDVTSFVKKKTDFDSKITEVEGKIPNISGLSSNSSLTVVEHKVPDIISLITKTDFDAKLKDISDRVTNNKSKDLLLDNELKKSKTLVGSTAKTKSDEGQIADGFVGGFYYYLQQSYLVYECKVHSFSFKLNRITVWKSTGIYNYSDNSNMAPTTDANNQLPELKTDGRKHVYLNGNYFVQNRVIIPNNNNVINIYCVYQLDPISSSRDIIQNEVYNSKCSIWNYTNY